MTDEQKADKYAKAATWQEENSARHAAAALAWYRRNKSKARNASWRYDQDHYQERLAYFRDRSRAKNDATRKIPYRPRLAARIPEYCENSAHARSVTRAVKPVDFGTAAAIMR